MSAVFIGQIEMFALDFAPQGWLACEGQRLDVAQFQLLFSLLGDRFGGNGVTTFCLPNLNRRIPIGMSRTHPFSLSDGEARHTLMASCVPEHTHAFNVDTNPGTTNTPTADTILAAGIGSHAGDPVFPIYNYATVHAHDNALVALAGQSVSSVGGQAHENMMPYLMMNYCISFVGDFPKRA